MNLLLILIIPLLVGLVGFVLSLYSKEHFLRITPKEFVLHLVLCFAFAVIGIFIARSIKTHDTEIWSGYIAKKWSDNDHCCHSYRCRCRNECTGTSNSKSCREVCDTCYQHSYDVGWYAKTTNNEVVYSDTCNAPFTQSPKRWDAIQVGEPSAFEHGFINYIKANPDSVLRTQGVAERFTSKIPKYPCVYDHYRATRFISANVKIPNDAELNVKLAEINASLGKRKQVNIIVVVVNEGDQMYLEALREKWIGGKKNDLIVVVGTPNFPEIAWAGVVSWTRVEELKITIRDRIMQLNTFNGEDILKILREEIEQKFVRTPMADFSYLAATIEPPTWAIIVLFILNIGTSVGLQWFFWNNEVHSTRV